MNLPKTVKYHTVLLMILSFFPTHSSSASCGKTLMHSGISETEKQMILDVHNKFRQLVALGEIGNQPPASNMLKLTWSDSLAQKAQQWTMACNGQTHDPNRHYGNYYVGQNLASKWTTSSPRSYQDMTADWMSDAISKWFVEHSNYHFPTFGSNKYYSVGNGKTGHYTQMIWADTASIGCGYSYYVDTSKRYTKKYVCNYGPSGNVRGAEPYQKGYPSCYKFGLQDSRQYPGLCEYATSNSFTNYHNDNYKFNPLNGNFYDYNNKNHFKNDFFYNYFGLLT